MRLSDTNAPFKNLDKNPVARGTDIGSPKSSRGSVLLLEDDNKENDNRGSELVLNLKEDVNFVPQDMVIERKTGNDREPTRGKSYYTAKGEQYRPTVRESVANLNLKVASVRDTAFQYMIGVDKT